MTLESADNKVREICELLRKESLEPAQIEAKRIVELAEIEGDEIIQKAKKEALKVREENKAHLARELQVHEGSIQLSIRQGISELRQSIEKIFLADLEKEIEKTMISEDVISEVIRVLLSQIEKQGLDSDLKVLLPKQVNIDRICSKLTTNFLARVKKGGAQVEDVKGGALIKMVDKKISIELTDTAVKELLASFVIPELRKKIFT